MRNFLISNACVKPGKIYTMMPVLNCVLLVATQVCVFVIYIMQNVLGGL